ncbi:MAG: AI-2E family transporter [Chloroflexi bacterium]|nr:AI-2E family transporter [Chloroflexota bacterium]
MLPKWSQTTHVMMAAVSLLVIGIVLYLSRPLMGPLLLAILLAYLLDPVVEFVEKRTPLTSKVSSTIVFFLFVTILITLISTLVPVLIRQAVSLVGDLTDVELYIEELMARPLVVLGQEFRLNQPQFSQLLENLTPAVEDAFNVLEVTSTGFVWTLVVFVTAYYFLLDGSSINKWLVSIATEETQGDMRRLLKEVDSAWRAYVRGTLSLMLIVGIVFTLVLSAVGLRGAVALGILSGLLIVLPELGPLISGVLSVIVAYFWGSDFLPMSNFWFAVLVAAIYFTLMQIRAIWLQPRLIGRFLHLHPGLVFVVLIATLVQYGALPALYVIPILASFGIVARYVRSKLLGLDPWSEGTSRSLVREMVKQHEPSSAKPAWLENLEQRRKKQLESKDETDIDVD